MTRSVIAKVFIINALQKMIKDMTFHYRHVSGNASVRKWTVKLFSGVRRTPVDPAETMRPNAVFSERDARRKFQDAWARTFGGLHCVDGSEAAGSNLHAWRSQVRVVEEVRYFQTGL